MPGTTPCRLHFSIRRSTVETKRGFSNWPGMPTETETSAGPTIAMSKPGSESSSSARSIAVVVPNWTNDPSGCSVRFRLTLQGDGPAEGRSPIAMRGFPVAGGQEILAFQTDPGAIVAARFNFDGK
jgi:hypothetical protein